MAEWTTLVGPEPNEMLENSLNQVSDALSDFEAALQEVSDAVGTVEEILSILATNDPITAILDLVAGQLENYIEDLLKTGLYFLPVLPGPATVEFFRPFPTESALFMISDSLADRLDSERPQSSNNAGYGAVVFLGGVSDFFDFAELLKSLKALFGDQSKWGQLADLFASFEYENLKPERGHRQSEGVGWNWTSIRLEEIEAVENALLQAKAFISSLRINANTILSDAIEIVRKRIKYYLNVVKQIVAFLQFLARLSNLLASMNILPILNNTGGIPALQRDIINSTNKPLFQYSAGFVIASVFPDPLAEASFKAGAQLFGVQQSLWANL